jgi:hypothetical protein
MFGALMKRQLHISQGTDHGTMEKSGFSTYLTHSARNVKIVQGTILSTGTRKFSITLPCNTPAWILIPRPVTVQG